MRGGGLRSYAILCDEAIQRDIERQRAMDVNGVNGWNDSNDQNATDYSGEDYSEWPDEEC